MSLDADPRRVEAARRVTAAVPERAGGVRAQDGDGTVRLPVGGILTDAIAVGRR